MLSLSSHKIAMPLLALIGLGGTSASLFAQYVLGMNPCVMCIQQRMALAGIFIVSLLCWCLPQRKRWARTVSSLLVAAPAAFGLYIASQQIYLQSLPLMEQPSCGAPWTFRLRHAPLFDWYEWFIRGTGVCGEVYQVLGVSLPVWSALFFLATLILIVERWWHTRHVN